LISLCFIAEINRYSASKPKNNPRGSDLNHPKFPLCMIAGLNANKSAENIPAVVLLPIVRTSAKIIIVVIELRITGSIIVKSNNEILIIGVNMLYKKAATIWRAD
jgi:hypothetical protein